MKFIKSANFYIAKNIMDSILTKNQALEYDKWIEFVNRHSEQFIWYENTKDGIEALANIDKVPENFKERVLGSLDKVKCFKEFDEKKGYYNINCSFSSENNWVSIGFERTPKPEDLKIFVEMANHLDALLLKDGNEIIDKQVIERLT